MLVPLGTVTALMVVLAAKHFCADFLFQNGWIAAGKSAPQNWMFPLALHAGGHAILTFLIVFVLQPRLWWIAPLEFVVHAAIDRTKVLIGRRAQLNPAKTEFWWLLGFDQFLHQLTNVAIACAILASGSPAA